MTISTKHLIESINAGTLNACNVSVIDVIASAQIYKELLTVNSVANIASLPAAMCNTGKLIWVSDIADYRYSDGSEWVRDFNSVSHKSNSVFSWGCNNIGQLGDNTIANKLSPVSVVGGFTDWCQVSACNCHSAALRTNGTLWTWGYNCAGQLGNNTIVNASSPVSVVGGFADWCQVSAGNSHISAVRTNGTLWAWGYNGFGQLGDNTLVNKSSPVQVVGGFTDWCQVGTGGQHTAAIRTNGTLWAWGFNTQGQLGDNTTVLKSSPVSVVGGFTDWCQVSASAHTAAVRTNGTLWAWGWNSSGQLGDNTIVDRSSPVSVIGGLTNWCQVSAGSHTAAVRTNGTLWTWGCNNKGQLGDNTIANKSSPVSVVGGFTDWCQVSASAHTAAIRTNGTVWTWGVNAAGQLGDNTIVSKSSPVSVVGGFTDWCRICASNSSTVALRVKNVGF